MFFHEGYLCPTCQQKFAEADDVVVCPQCGAPHHRACWEQEGHCHFEADHGTPRQWKRQPTADEIGAPSAEQQVCPRCGAANAHYAEFCARCGADLDADEWPDEEDDQPRAADGQSYTPPAGYGEYAPYRMPTVDPCGGVSPEETIEGVTAGELATYVGANSAYYVPRFYRLFKTGSTLSWNWPAFLIPEMWFLYRKQYGIGALTLAFFAVQSLLVGWLQSAKLLPLMDVGGEEALLQGEGARYFAAMLLLSLLTLLVRVIFGMTANALYRRHATAEICRARETCRGASEGEYRVCLAKVGGVSFVLVLVAAGVEWLVSMALQMWQLNL